MNLHNPISAFVAIARQFSRSFVLLTETLARNGMPRPPPMVSGGPFSPAPASTGNVAAPLVETPPARAEVSAFVALAPSSAETKVRGTVKAPAPAPMPVRKPVVEATPPAARASARRCPVVAPDPALDAIREQLAAMETRVVDLETRKAEMEQLLDEYAYCQYCALGELLGEQLRLQHELLARRAEQSSDAADREAADRAAEEYQAYQEACDKPAAPLPELVDGERDELKALYRAAAMRCHPDRVDDAARPLAHEMFLRTQDAYRRRDLEAMRQITRQLAAGKMPPANDDATPRARLELVLENLLDKGVELLLAIQAMEAQTLYRRARKREKWDEQFAAARNQLERDCRVLRRKIAAC